MSTEKPTTQLWRPTALSGFLYVAAIGCAFSDYDSPALMVMNACFLVATVAPWWAWNRRGHGLIGLATTWVKAGLVAYLLWGQWGFDYNQIEPHHSGNTEIFWMLGPALIITGVIELILGARYAPSVAAP